MKDPLNVVGALGAYAIHHISICLLENFWPQIISRLVAQILLSATIEID